MTFSVNGIVDWMVFLKCFKLCKCFMVACSEIRGDVVKILIKLWIGFYSSFVFMVNVWIEFHVFSDGTWAPYSSLSPFPRDVQNLSHRHFSCHIARLILLDDERLRMLAELFYRREANAISSIKFVIHILKNNNNNK